jgi:hypothetical protein
MPIQEIFKQIGVTVNQAPRNAYVAELHLQVIKYAEQLKDVTGKEFCNGVGIAPSFGTEFSKMRKISDRLMAAGLDVSKI